MLQPVKTQFDDVLNFNSYSLINCDQRYDDCVAKRIAKTPKPIQVQMRNNTFDLAELIRILNFQWTFKTTCDINAESEGAAMWLFHLFIRSLAVS